MASPFTLNIIPKCGLEIEFVDSDDDVSYIKSSLDLDHSDWALPRLYRIVNHGDFQIKDSVWDSLISDDEDEDSFVQQSGNNAGGQMREEDSGANLHNVNSDDEDDVYECDLFEGWLSPTHAITLPDVQKEEAGIPPNAAYYAFMHPPPNLGKSIDFNRPEDNFTDNNDIDVETNNRKAAMYLAVIFGGFVYFDTQMKVLQVNALSVDKKSALYTGHSGTVKLSGPFRTKKTTFDDLREMNRIHVVPLGIFHEAGFGSMAWIRPEEKLHSDHILVEENHHLRYHHGALVFFNDYGSAVLYIVEDSDVYFDTSGSVSHFVDAIESGKLNIKLFSNEADNQDDANSILVSSFIQPPRNNKIELLQQVARYMKDHTLQDGSTMTKRMVQDAAKECHVDIDDIFKKLKQKEFQWTPLHFLCRFAPNDSLVMKVALAYFGNDTVTKPDILNRYPLHIACDGRATQEVIQVLIEAERSSGLTGAIQQITRTSSDRVVNKATSNLKKLPLHAACCSRRPVGVINLLLESAENWVSAQNGQGAIYQMTNAGCLPLHLSLLYKAPVETVKVLIKADKENKTLYEPYNGMLPIHLACWFCCPTETVSLLLKQDKKKFYVSSTVDTQVFIGRQNNPDYDVESSTVTALNLSLRRGSPEIIKLLLRQITSLKAILDNASKISSYRYTQRSVRRRSTIATNNTTVNRGLVPLPSRRNSTLRVTNELINNPDKDGKVALHNACERGLDNEIIKSLLVLDRFNRTTYMIDDKGCMPIHYACQNNIDVKIIETLLRAEEKYRKVLIANRTNTAPWFVEQYQRSLRSDSEDTTRWKRDKGVPSTSIVDKLGKSPLNHALRNNVSDDVIEVLIRPENIYLTGLDDYLRDKLATRIRNNVKLQSNIIEKLSDRVYLVGMIFELYFSIVRAALFIRATELLLDQKSASFQAAILMYAFVPMSILLEISKLKSAGFHYYMLDFWSFFDISSLILLILSIKKMMNESLAIENVPIEKIDRVIIFTGAILLMSIVFLLRSLFLPFARFVGGIALIFLNLIPFFIVSIVFLAIFAFSFRSEGGQKECEESFTDCYMFVIGIFFQAAESDRMLHVLFNVVGVIIFFNVVIAIVGEAWNTSKERTSQYFWNFRLNYLSEMKFISNTSKRFAKRWCQCGIFYYIDGLRDLSLTDKISWDNPPYNSVLTRHQYYNPSKHFSPETAKPISSAHSLQADLFWIDKEAESLIGKKANRNVFWKKVIAIVGFGIETLRYVFLLILGLVSFGFLWPRGFRRGVLGIGTDYGKNHRHSNQKDA